MMVRQYNGNIYNQKINQWDHFKIPESQVSGMDAVSVKVVPSTLCGTLTGQHSEQHLVQLLKKNSFICYQLAHLITYTPQ